MCEYACKWDRENFFYFFFLSCFIAPLSRIIIISSTRWCRSFIIYVHIIMYIEVKYITKWIVAFKPFMLYMQQHIKFIFEAKKGRNFFRGEVKSASEISDIYWIKKKINKLEAKSRKKKFFFYFRRDSKWNAITKPAYFSIKLCFHFRIEWEWEVEKIFCK